MASFEEAVVRAKVAKICDYVGYHAITKESAAILVDLYIKTFSHLARHCKDFANYNRRTEPTLTDLIQAYDFVGISIPELKEHADNVKIHLDIKIDREEPKPSNRIQRDRFVDDQLEEEKNNDQLDDNEEGRNNDDEESEDKNMTPLLKDIYQEITNQFPSPSKPVKADKIRIKREEKPVIPKLKITPLDPSIAEPPSFLPILENIKQENLGSPLPPLSARLPQGSDKPGRGRKKGIKNKVAKTKLKAAQKNAKLKTKIKTKPLKGQKRGRKPNAVKLAAAAAAAAAVATTSKSPELREPSPAPSTPSPVQERQASPSPPPQASTSTISKARIKLETQARHSPMPPEEIPQETPKTTKQAKKDKKKKKKSSNQFAIVTETVTAESEEREWLCPTCHGPDNGNLMVGCDTCDLWYHLLCTNLKREPKEEEKWSCIRCTSKNKTPPPEPLAPIVVSTSRGVTSGVKDSKKKKKKSHPPAEVPQKATEAPEPELAPIEPLRIPIEPQVKTPPVPEPLVAAPRPPPVGSSSQDDLCPECNLPDDGTLMIQCDDPFCARWFHGKCVGVLAEPSDTDSWFCTGCVEKQASAFKRRRRI